MNPPDGERDGLDAGRFPAPRRSVLRRLRGPVRSRDILLALATFAALLLLVRASGWSPVSHDALPVTAYAPRLDPEPRHAQTLAHGNFEADGGEFAWEVFGFREIGSGVHSFQYRVHRVGGAPTFVWPEAALLEHARLGNLGETPLGDGASVEQGVLVVRQGFQSRGPGTYDMTAILRLEVARDVAWGSRALDPIEVRLPLTIEAAGAAPRSP